ncbi:hypothetical protein OPN55_004796, partial [Salmonella enterica subsp. enterica serovar Anatum]|nr:hypothetical protein [Salmonella enterica subsp. enterica serovar Anatum]ELY8416863.1 hypothetical protein [Salmonella enterica]
LQLSKSSIYSTKPHELALDDTTRAGTYNLRASYVMAPGVTSDAVTSGAVTTNSIYSIVYN